MGDPDAFAGAMFLPSWSLRVEPGESGFVAGARARLPEARGVIGFADSEGRIFALAQTANLRRFARSRLEPLETSHAAERDRTRRAEYRALTRVIFAITSGSAFESDWAMLHLARSHLPRTAKALSDHWRGWWVHVNPKAKFPRLTKTCTPGSSPAGARGVYLGPLPDKHAAQRYLEMLQKAFDLCRHHHLLVLAPSAAPCAYKELGRCPAPCDGTIELSDYRRQVRSAIEFAERDAHLQRQSMAAQMNSAALELDFERAAMIKRVLDDTRVAGKPEARHVDRHEAFAYLAVLPSERRSHARCFAIAGGCIQPIFDIARDAKGAALIDAAAAVTARAAQLRSRAIALDQASIENLGLAATHLFRPAMKREGVFIKVARSISAEDLQQALDELLKVEAQRARIRGRKRNNAPTEHHDREIESLLEEFDS